MQSTSLSHFGLNLPVPCIYENCIEIKIKLNFNFHTSLWCLNSEKDLQINSGKDFAKIRNARARKTKVWLSSLTPEEEKEKKTLIEGFHIYFSKVLSSLFFSGEFVDYFNKFWISCVKTITPKSCIWIQNRSPLF